MKRTRRVISFFVALSFLLTSIPLDTVSAQRVMPPNTDKLAPAIMCDDLAGIEHKDIGRIKFALMERLLPLIEKGMPLNEANLTTIVKPLIHEETKFRPAEVQLFYHEMEQVSGGLLIKCKIDSVRTYYTVLSHDQGNKTNGFSINVYTENEYKKFNGLKAALPARKHADENAIDRYIQHERNIDRWIRAHMEDANGETKENFTDFVEMRSWGHVARCLRNDLTEHNDAIKFISKNDHKTWEIITRFLHDQRLVFIKVKKDEKRPVIIEDGKEIEVNGHPSKNGIYIFVDEEKFILISQYVRSVIERRVSDLPTPDEETVIFGEIGQILMHEMGAKYNFKWSLTSEGIENSLDRLYKEARDLSAGKKTDMADFQSLIKEVYAEYRDGGYKKANLDENLITRDYAAGEKLPAFLKVDEEWRVSIPYIEFCEKVYRHSILEKEGLLLKDGKPYGNKEALEATRQLSKVWLQDLKTILPAEAYEKIEKSIITKEGIEDAAASYLRYASLASLGRLGITYDRQNDVYVVWTGREDAEHRLGQLVATEYTKGLSYNKLGIWAGSATINGKKIVVRDAIGDRAYVKSLIKQGRLGRLADNHAHIEAQVSSDFIWSIAIGNIDLPDIVSKELRGALYPLSREDRDRSPVVDWNEKGKPDYVDLVNLLIEIRNLRGKLITDLDVKGKISDQELAERMWSRSEEPISKEAEKYFALKQVFMEHIVWIPYDGSRQTFMNFLKVYDTTAAVLKQRMTANGKMSKEVFAALSAFYVERIIEENKDNSYVEIRIQPKYDKNEMELTLKAIAEAVKIGRGKHPKLTTNLVIVFRRRETPDMLRQQASWLVEILRNNPDLRDIIKGWDAASLEVGCPPANLVRAAQEITQYNTEYPNTPLLCTYHAAEDWEGIVSGRAHDAVTAMRYVDEVIEKFHPVALGHALGVMIPFSSGSVAAKQNVNRSELIKTLDWLMALKKTHNVPIDTEKLDAVRKKTENLEGDAVITFEEPFLSEEEIFQISRHIIRKVIERGIYIEVNPISNIMSRYINKMENLPLIKLLKSGLIVRGEDFSGLLPLLTINSDDPGLTGFSGGVADEFINVGATLLNVGLSRDSVESYLEVLAYNGRSRGAVFAREGMKNPSNTVRSGDDFTKTLGRPGMEGFQEKQVSNMAPLAHEAARSIPTYPPEKRCNLLVMAEFFGNSRKELEAHQKTYGDRFDLDMVSGENESQFVDNVLSKAGDRGSRTIVLIPKDLLSNSGLSRLKAAGIRFIKADGVAFLKARLDKDDYRGDFQRDTYAIMLLARSIDKNTPSDSSLYELLRFYVKSHFDLDAIAVDDYINALVNGDIAKLIKGCLSYRPAKPYDAAVEYKNIAEALLSA